MKSLVVSAAAFVALMASAPAAWAADYDIVGFWRSHPPGSVMEGDTPSAQAPGKVPTGFSFVNVASDTNVSPAELALVKRRLELALQEIMRQPSMKDLRGAFAMASMDVSRLRASGAPGALTATLNLIVRPLDLDDPQTHRDAAGRYSTPGEGVTLELTLNPTRFMRGADITGSTPIPGGARLQVGSSPVILLSGAPLPQGWTGESLGRRWENDRTWTSAQGNGEAAMLVYLGAGRHQNIALDRGTLRPTAPYGRLAAAAQMIDWKDLRTRMLAIR